MAMATPVNLPSDQFFAGSLLAIDYNRDPEHRDAVVVLRQIRQGLDRYADNFDSQIVCPHDLIVDAYNRAHLTDQYCQKSSFHIDFKQ
jgi:hypothetical protein